MFKNISTETKKPQYEPNERREHEWFLKAIDIFILPVAV